MFKKERVARPWQPLSEYSSRISLGALSVDCVGRRGEGIVYDISRQLIIIILAIVQVGIVRKITRIVGYIGREPILIVTVSDQY